MFIIFYFPPSIKLKNVRAERKQSQCLSLAEMDTVGASLHPFHTRIKREISPPPHPWFWAVGGVSVWRCVGGGCQTQVLLDNRYVPFPRLVPLLGLDPAWRPVFCHPPKEGSLRVACVSPPRTLPPHRLLHTESPFPDTASEAETAQSDAVGTRAASRSGAEGLPGPTPHPDTSAHRGGIGLTPPSERRPAAAAAPCQAQVRGALRTAQRGGRSAPFPRLCP